MTNVDNWPLYFKEALIIKNPSNNIAIPTLWMPKETVAEGVGEVEFCGCGQLYTKRGINPMFRNILANPNIRYLVLCGVDRQGSGEALLKFFSNGFEPVMGESGEVKAWKVIGDEETFLDKEISEQALTLLKESVQIFDLRLRPVGEIKDKVIELNKVPLEAFSEPLYFDEPVKETVDRIPSDMSVFKIRREFVGEAWLDVIKTVMKFGATTPGMYSNVKEVHNLAVVVEKEDPDKPILPSYLGVGEESLTKYIQGFFDTDIASQAYTYGERIFTWDNIDQFKEMSAKLKRFPYDRGALAVLWKPHVDNFPPKDIEIKEGGQTKKWNVPCLVMIMAQCLDEKLNMTCVFRNNDMFGSWHLNSFALRTLQKKLAIEIGKDMGSLTTISHIAEIYERDWSEAKKVLDEHDSVARTCTWETRSYYIVELNGNNIVVRFYTPDGVTQLGEFIEDGTKPKAARDISAQIFKEMLISDVGAACDLGRQLAKAETAVKLGLKFMQDQPLKFKD